MKANRKETEGYEMRIAPTLIVAMFFVTNTAGCRPTVTTTTGDQRGQVEIPNCAGVEQWPTSMAFTYLKNNGITDSDRLDFTKTQTRRLASEQISDRLFRQVHHVVFIQKSGQTIETITVNDASNDECSESGVDVYVISQQLGPN